MGILLAGFYFYEKQDKARIIELELQTELVGTLPVFFRPGGPGSGGPRSSNALPPRPGSTDRNQRPPRRPVEERPPFLHMMQRFDDANRYLYVENSNGELLYSTENFPDIILSQIEQADGNVEWQFHQTDEYIFAVHGASHHGRIILGTYASELNQTVQALLLQSTWIALSIILLSSAVGYYLIRSSLKPIQDIGQAAQDIAKGDLTKQIDTVAIDSELGQLARVLNETFSRLSKALQRQIQFTSDASHELRTPVAAILADCQFSLKRERSPERYRETIEVCHESAQHMRSLIEDLRDLASFDEREEALVSEYVSLKDFLQSLTQVMTPLAQEKELNIESQCTDGTAYFDAMRMRQAILNVIGNAIRYTEPGGTIRISNHQKDGESCIEISDTGIGIAPDKIKYIFDRFYRTDSARNNHTGGVGLGLSITKSIVEANGGRIYVESQLGVGTTFRIHLPHQNQNQSTQDQ